MDRRRGMRIYRLSVASRQSINGVYLMTHQRGGLYITVHLQTYWSYSQLFHDKALMVSI
jgi:hypothetical protein